MTVYKELLEKHIPTVALLRSLLVTELSKEQQDIVNSFLLNNLLEQELSPIRESISTRLETNLRAMDKVMKVDQLAKYLDI